METGKDHHLGRNGEVRLDNGGRKRKEEEERKEDEQKDEEELKEVEQKEKEEEEQKRKEEEANEEALKQNDGHQCLQHEVDMCFFDMEQNSLGFGSCGRLQHAPHSSAADPLAHHKPVLVEGCDSFKLIVGLSQFLFVRKNHHWPVMINIIR